MIISTKIQIESDTNPEAGFDLGIISLEYLNKDITAQNFNIIQNTPFNNLKGGKIFFGYTSKLCDRKIVILYSMAIITEEIQAFFSRFRRKSCLEL